jgi:hypothetical protein
VLQYTPTYYLSSITLFYFWTIFLFHILLQIIRKNCLSPLKIKKNDIFHQFLLPTWPLNDFDNIYFSPLAKYLNRNGWLKKEQMTSRSARKKWFLQFVCLFHFYSVCAFHLYSVCLFHFFSFCAFHLYQHFLIFLRPNESDPYFFLCL